MFPGVAKKKKKNQFDYSWPLKNEGAQGATSAKVKNPWSSNLC